MNISTSNSNKSTTKSYSAHLTLEELKNIGAKTLNEKGTKGRFANGLKGVIEKNSFSLVKLANKFVVSKDDVKGHSNDLSIRAVEVFGGLYRQNAFDFFIAWINWKPCYTYFITYFRPKRSNSIDYS
ncbi:hypothetical protein K502DRAFT_326689 [Neoconidiobolus thromboides FSU 785]|nr:hypothetical protein K502DRAFT_326689 [Neoconidiobolus thromboides FSU 785]